jgi:hypothetical protein
MKSTHVAAALGVLAMTATTAHADLRSFTYTYEYSTVPAGETSVELWHTMSRVDAPMRPERYEGVLEIEHGLTEKLDAGFYTYLADGETGGVQEGLRLSRGELQARYRISERGELPVDPQLMLTVGKLFGSSTYSTSLRAIGARDFGDLTVAANVEGELLAGGALDGSEIYVRWMVGATYALHPRLRLGVESWAVVIDGTPYVDAGPAVSFAASPKFWIAATFGVGLTKRDAIVDGEHAELSGRAILGIEL